MFNRTDNCIARTRSRGVRTVAILFLCLSVLIQMLGVPPTLLSPALSLDTLGESVLEGFSIPPTVPLSHTFIQDSIRDGRPTICACADSRLRSVSSSCSLVSFPCLTSPRHFSCMSAHRASCFHSHVSERCGSRGTLFRLRRGSDLMTIPAGELINVCFVRQGVLRCHV